MLLARRQSHPQTTPPVPAKHMTNKPVCGCAESACSTAKHSHGELVVAIGSRVSKKMVNSVGQGPANHISITNHFLMPQQQGVSGISGMEQWNGIVEWNSGME